MKWHSLVTSAVLVSVSIASALGTPLAGRDDTIKVFKFRVSAPTYPGLDGKYISMKDEVAGIYGSAETAAADPMTAKPLMVYASRGTTSDTFSLGVCPIGFVGHTLALLGPPGNLEMTDVVNPASRTFPAGTEAKWGGWRLEGVTAFGGDGSAPPPPASAATAATATTNGGYGARRVRRAAAAAEVAKRQEGPIAPKKGKNGPGTKSTTSSGNPAADKEGGRVTYSDDSNSRWLAFPARNKGDWTVKWYDGTAFIITDYMPIDIFYEPVDGNLSEICPM